MHETSQQQADRMLQEDQARRAAHKRARQPHRLLAAARLLAGCCADCGQAAPAPHVSGCPAPLWGPAAPTLRLGDRFGRAPYSRADQARNALAASFEHESPMIRAKLWQALNAASDATLERAGRMLKHG